MDQAKLKAEFARELLKTPDDPYKAAFNVIPDTGQALQLAKAWQNDPEVVAEQLRLIGTEGRKSFLPTKEEQAAAVYALANSALVDEENRLKAHRLFAEIMSYIDKDKGGGTVNVLNQGVMIVKDHGSNKEWESEAVRQQRELTSGHVIDATAN